MVRPRDYSRTVSVPPQRRILSRQTKSVLMTAKPWMAKFRERLIDRVLGANTVATPSQLHQLAARNLPKEHSRRRAQAAINKWERAHAVSRIHRAYRRGPQAALFKLIQARLSVYEYHVETHLYGIRAHYAGKNWAACSDACEALRVVDADNIEAARFMARCAKKLGDESAVSDNLERIVESCPKDQDALVGLIKSHYNQGNSTRVLQLANRALLLNPKSSDAHRYLMRALFSLELFEEALASANALLERVPSDVEATFQLGRIQLKLGAPHKSRELLERALALDPTRRRTKQALATVYERVREWEKAELLLAEECRHEPLVFSTWERRVNALLISQREAEAKSCIKEILDITNRRLSGYLLAHTLAESYSWMAIANELFCVATRHWGNEVEFNRSVAERSLDSGELTNALRHLRSGQAIDSSDEGLRKIEQRMKAMLLTTATSMSVVETALESGQVLFHTECAIRHITNIAARERPARQTGRKVMVVSSSLGRGGAERQVVTCLAGLVKEDSIASVDFCCDALDKTAGRQATYAPELLEIGVETHQFVDRKKWDEEYKEFTHHLDEWSGVLAQLPNRMRRQVEPLFLAFKAHEPDIVHGWQDVTNINVAMAALMARVPGIVLFARSMRPDQKTLMHSRNSRFVREGYLAVLSRPNVLLCHNSEAGAQSYADWLGKGLEEFEIIHNGVDLKTLVRDSQGADVRSTLREHGVPDEATIIGSVFRFVEEKQPRLWVDAVAKVIEARPDVHAVIVGSGGRIEDCLAHISELGLTSRIHLVGHSRQIKAWLDVFDVFLLTSKTEGLPNVLVEAQSFGVPVISTDAGGASDTFLDGKTGALVTTQSASIIAQTLLDRLDDREWMATASREATELARVKFSPETMLQRLLEIYSLSLRSS